MKTLRNTTLAIIALLLAAVPALADLVTFDPQPLGTIYGSTVGQPQGTLMFHEGFADLHTEDFWLAGSPYYYEGRIEPATASFGSGRILRLNNMDIKARFSAPGDVMFRFMDLGGSVNLQVNGSGVILDPNDMAMAPAVVAPGVTCTVTTTPVPGGHKGVVTLTGPVLTLQVGGQEFWLDDIKCDNGRMPVITGCDFVVDHESLGLGDTWSAAAGATPGDLMFTEDGIPVTIGEMDWGTGSMGFNLCKVEGASGSFGTGNIMNINNVSNEYGISSLGITVRSVSFEYLDLGGMENLQVNGGTLHIGDLSTFPAAVAPGVTMSVTSWPVAGGVQGEVVLTGDVQTLLLAGQEFWVDDICVMDAANAPAPGGCDLLSDNESQVPGRHWGGPYGNLPGDAIFAEDGIQVGIDEWTDGSTVMFLDALADAPWGPLGSGVALHLNNICATYDFGAVGTLAEVKFDYVDGAGTENLAIDGTLYIGDIDAIPAGYFPGFTVSVTVNSGPGYIYGTVTVTGNVHELKIGGQQFYIDNVCATNGSGAMADVPLAGPRKIALGANYPNPFNPSTTLCYSLARAGRVNLSIIDVAGRRVATLVDGAREAGDHQVMWHGRTDDGRAVPSGMYFVRIQGGGETAVRKIALLK
jgi:hypothetical protein